MPFYSIPINLKNGVKEEGVNGVKEGGVKEGEGVNGVKEGEGEGEGEVEEIKEEVSNYCKVIKKVKKENITKDNIGEIMLCQIPGISSVSAIAIMKEFKTFQNLILKVNESTDCLKNISYINCKGDTRKINKTVITNIVKFLKD
jgi:hypothetical protein